MKEHLPFLSKFFVVSVLGLQLLVALPAAAMIMYVTWTLLKVLYIMLRPLLNLIL